MYNFIGIDVAKRTLQIYIEVNDSSVEINNEEKSLKTFYKTLKKLYKNDKPFVFIYEPTANYSVALTKFCAENNVYAYMVNTFVSSNFSKSLGNRNKTDISDAQMLFNMQMMINKKDIAVPVKNPTVDALRELVGYYRFLQKQKVAFKNYNEAVTTNKSSNYILKDVKKNIARIDKEQQELINKAKAIITNDEVLKKAFAHIISIKGVGTLVGIFLLHLFLNYPNANRQQITALLGLDPITIESGTSIKKRSRISKRGLSMYRGVIFYSILSTVRFNEEFRTYYEHLKDRKKHTTLAQIAVMRKLILLAHSLYKNNVDYNPEQFKLKKVAQKEICVA
ncbi:IS110 family transposase [Sulfurimonas autotrophica]|uniref:Transposase IS116/IS110/IS902 family protein n=1 Tax=Sulfurimonas autotrophica (strain ATCC BAA-671 / DSM 16294 / JCM 11897 / OK10) TaxID=563040 RepID=E0USY6_SULAO|nr:IS110 family transposase [Sulfurimonas autotrophica]ADN09227.1 transposase IS116/IS110/IS902 family protein [Sulfurimonas autotrophica DSM 16294]ADN09229.1 transposase IS116/IS110/IS902 family protein [Sulfurimonas autotrophica DSM 16294]